MDAVRVGGGGGEPDGPDSGLKLLGHRYYDSRTGRFISQDPAGDGDNWYAYCGNDPMNGVDPSGLTPDPNPNEWSINGGSSLDYYNIVAATAANAGISANIAQSAGLIARFNYYEVFKITFLSNGLPLAAEHLFYFAVPIGTSIMGNFHAARGYAGTHYLNVFGRNISMGSPSKADTALYVYHHFKNATVGDFKDKQFGSLGQPKPGTRLYDLADIAGNVNGSMGMQGLGMSSWEIARSGDVHIAIFSQFRVLHDDPIGAAALQVGYNYGLRQP